MSQKSPKYKNKVKNEMAKYSKKNIFDENEAKSVKHVLRQPNTVQSSIQTMDNESQVTEQRNQGYGIDQLQDLNNHLRAELTSVIV